MEDLFRIGSIATTHGVHGEVKVYPTTDDPGRYKKIKEVILDNGKEKKTAHIEQTKFFKQMVIVKFKEYHTMDEAEKLRGYELYVTREHAIPLKKNEYYIADLIGMTVLTDEGNELGIIEDVLQTGANDVYVVKQTSGKEVLLPAIKDCILSVDVEAKMMKVHVLDGLLDL
ncbi:MAG: ribosome maturation factor RimM [Lachnospiraceae bacterium]